MELENSTAIFCSEALDSVGTGLGSADSSEPVDVTSAFPEVWRSPLFLDAPDFSRFETF